jgi:histidyl-tRNA synthetase
MAIGEFRIRINNRKVLKGLLKNFDVPEASAAAVLRILDKVEKENEASLLAQLEKEGLGSSAKGLYGLMATKRTTEETLRALSDYPACADGVAELRAIVDAIRKFGVPDSAFAVDLAIVRGLDYYTGTIYETALTAYPEIGSICSGGRYDDLASYFTNTKLPGVGISIGLTRLFTKLKEANLLKPLPRTPAEVLVTTMDHQYLDKYLETAKMDKQLQYASRKEFRVALIAGESEFANSVVQIKDLSTRESRTVPIDNLVTPIKELLKN